MVEDMRRKVRQDSRGNANRVQRVAHIQNVANSAGTLEGRGITHPAALTKEVWIRNSHTASARSRKKMHLSRSHKLSAKWSNILLPKYWVTNDENQPERGGRLEVVAQSF